VTTEEQHFGEGIGYPVLFVRRASQPRTAVEPTEEPKAMAIIPHVAELSEAVRQVCRRYNNRMVFQSAPLSTDS